MHSVWKTSILFTIVTTVLLGLGYPLFVTGVAAMIFPHKAAGSLILKDGKVIGSELLAQSFTSDRYFHPRPSAAGNGYDDTLSTGTNLGPTSAKLADTLIAQAVDSAVKNEGAVKGKIPSDMVTSSASGLDPHVSPATAFVQVARVARARHADSSAVRALVDKHVEGRQFGFFGEPRVNVLLLNLDLDRTLPLHAAP